MHRGGLFLLGLSFALPGFGFGPAYAHLSTTRSAPTVQAVDEAVHAAAERAGLEGYETRLDDSIGHAPLRTASADRHFSKPNRLVRGCAGSRHNANGCSKPKYKTAAIRFRAVKTSPTFRDRALPAEQIASGFRTGVLGAFARVIGGDEGDVRLR